MHIAQKELLETLGSLINNFGIYDVGADGGLKGGPLNLLYDLNKSILLNFEATREQPDQSEWIKRHESFSSKLNTKTLSIPFLADNASRTRIFYETAKAQCSSCLLPDLQGLSDYHNFERFKIKDSFYLKTISIDEVSSATRIAPSIVKIDTQGFD